MKKAFLLFVMVLAGILAVSSVVSALPLTINHVWVDGTEVYETSTNHIRALDKNEQIPIKVELEVDSNLTASLEDVQVEANIRGYDQKDLIDDITAAFTAQPGVTYDKNLDLTLPIRMDQDRYKLRIRIEDRDGESTEATYELEVEAQSHAIWIKDVILSPSDAVIAGRALLARVRVQNIGTQDETDGLRVTFAIPDLGISDTDYIDELDQEESTTSEDLYVRIPACVTEGLYTWYASVTYHDGDDTANVNGKILVQQGDVCPTSATQPEVTPVTIINVGAGSQGAVNGGAEVMYPITITNQEGAAKTYIISVDSGDWATFTVSPSNLLLLEKGETGTVFIKAKVNQNAPAGDNLFVVNVKKGAELIKQVSIKTTVVQATQKPVTQPTAGWDAVKKGLLIALIVLIIILIIIGLVIGFRKVRSDEETHEKGESYY